MDRASRWNDRCRGVREAPRYGTFGLLPQHPECEFRDARCGAILGDAPRPRNGQDHDRHHVPGRPTSWRECRSRRHRVRRVMSPPERPPNMGLLGGVLGTPRDAPSVPRADVADACRQSTVGALKVSHDSTDRVLGAVLERATMEFNPASGQHRASSVSLIPSPGGSMAGSSSRTRRHHLPGVQRPLRRADNRQADDPAPDRRGPQRPGEVGSAPAGARPGGDRAPRLIVPDATGAMAPVGGGVRSPRKACGGRPYSRRQRCRRPAGGLRSLGLHRGSAQPRRGTRSAAGRNRSGSARVGSRAPGRTLQRARRA